MTKEDALRKIKTLRDEINNTADTSAAAEGWENAVLEALDQASDLIEFAEAALPGKKLTLPPGYVQAIARMPK